MQYLCPYCDRELRKREMNYPENIRRREIESVTDQFVCDQCRETFDSLEVRKVREKTDPEWL